MRYSEYEKRLSKPRMERYLISVGGNRNKALYLYRLNLKLSQEIFSLLSCLEVALRNSIDQVYVSHFGPKWLMDSVSPTGFLTGKKCKRSKSILAIVIAKHRKMGTPHMKLLSDLDFGFWRYLFSGPQYLAGGRRLMAVFPKYVSKKHHNEIPGEMFDNLKKPNLLRNRIAHHEPICFLSNSTTISTKDIREDHKLICDLFRWMGIDENYYCMAWIILRKYAIKSIGSNR